LTKKYWLVIEPYVHISLKKDKVLFYNTLNGSYLLYYKPFELLQLVKKLISKKNLLVVPVRQEELESKQWLKDFVADIRENFIGDVVPQSLAKGKPFQMMPMVKNMQDVKYLKRDSFRSVGENIGEYLHSLTLYINGMCDLDCSFCDIAYKQGLCCTKGNSNQELSLSTLENLFKQTKESNLSRISITGGNIFKYSNFNKLLQLLLLLTDRLINFTFHVSNFDKEKVRQIVSAGFDLTAIVSLNYDIQEIARQLKELNVFSNMNYSFLVESEADFEKSEMLISEAQMKNYSYLPVFNGNNLIFFKDNIFLNCEDILESKSEQRDILAKQQLNQLNFGKIIIMSNNNVYANVNVPKIGVIGEEDIHKILYREMLNGKSFLKTRKYLTPCKSCVYQYLCPSPSNYELFFKRNNLCNVI